MNKNLKAGLITVSWLIPTATCCVVFVMYPYLYAVAMIALFSTFFFVLTKDSLK
jgi:hypothetical protein